MSHNDIYPRNILVSNINGKDTSQFHLIDFGMATKGVENPKKMIDLVCISETLYSLMLGRNIGAAARYWVNSSRSCQDRPYSNDLVTRVGQIYEAARFATFKAPLRRDWFDAMIAAFRYNTRKSIEAAEKVGKETKINVKNPLTDVEPWGIRMRDIETPMATMLKNESGCFPCQTAWIDVESLNVVRVDREVVWG